MSETGVKTSFTKANALIRTSSQNAWICRPVCNAPIREVLETPHSNVGFGQTNSRLEKKLVWGMLAPLKKLLRRELVLLHLWGQ